MSQPATLLTRLGPWVVLALAAVGCCPPKLQSYASPDDVLRSWQSQLCADDVVAEYECLSDGLKRDMGSGYEVYVVARRTLLEQQPFLAAALKYFDLPDRAVERLVDEQAGVARLTFEYDEQRFSIDFVRETWAVAEMADGPSLAAPLEHPLRELFNSNGDRQWINVIDPLPRLHEDDAQAAMTSFTLDERWKIHFISGLATPGTGP